MSKAKNPGRECAHRALDIDVLRGTVDAQNPIATYPEIQSETRAIASLMRRFPISFHHAKVVCELAGIGRAA